MTAKTVKIVKGVFFQVLLGLLVMAAMAQGDLRVKLRLMDCCDCWELPLHSQGHLWRCIKSGGSAQPPGDAVGTAGTAGGCLCTVVASLYRTFRCSCDKMYTRLVKKLDRDSMLS